MLTTQHTTDIIAKFETYLDDSTELPSQEELELCNKKYQEVCDDRPWIFLRKTQIGTVTTGVDTYGNTQVTIPLASDFKAMAINNQSTDNTVAVDNASKACVVFLSTKTGVYTPYQVVNYADRRQFLGASGYCWVDPILNQVTFASPPPTTIADQTYEFDYTRIPPDLTAATSTPYSDPVFPARFWDIIYHLAAVDDQIIQIFDRAHSYMAENKQNAMDILARMQYWDSQQYMD